MNRMKSLIRLLIIVAISFGSCSGSFLDVKPSTNLIFPEELDQLSKLLDNTNLVNYTSALGQMAGDEYEFVDYAAWQGTSTVVERNSYIWSKDLYEGTLEIRDWNWPYQSVFFANNVLQTIEEGQFPSSSERDFIKGWALFVRAYAYYDLLRTFSPAYDPATANTDLGVPLRSSPNVDEVKQRSSVQESYDFIISDLEQAGELLPDLFHPTRRNRPSKVAVNALLARIYTSMNKYVEAEIHADRSLSIYDKLMDYNSLSKTDEGPFADDNDEVLFSAVQINLYTITLSSATNRAVTINDNILNMYESNDLRRTLYFAQNPGGNIRPKRGYLNSSTRPFHGLAVDEVYLIKAECLARRGDIINSMDWLNRLLLKRYQNTEDFIPKLASNSSEAIDLIIIERQKELIWRGLRWSDIKRLNKMGADIVLRRTLNGVEYILPPNDPRYVFPIPDDEISASNIQQNLR